jgi:hypothetical protein
VIYRIDRVRGRLTAVLDRIVSGRTKVNALRELVPWEWKTAREAGAA